MSRLSRITVVNDFRGYQITVTQHMETRGRFTQLKERLLSMIGSTPPAHIIRQVPSMQERDLTIARKVFGLVTGPDQVITLEQIAREIETLPELIAYKIATSDGNGVMVDLLR